MTNLTEQWKKGELPEGWYYCYVNNEEYKFLYFDGDCFELDDPKTKSYYFFLLKDCENIKILAPVPTYEEWQELKEFADYSIHNRDELTRQINFWMQENTKLKDLLKEVLRHELSLKEVSELTRKIAQVLGEE